MLSRLNSAILKNVRPGLGCDCNPFLNTFTQSIRWKRKPIWFPVAKSKMFRIPERKTLPPDEAQEIRRLYNEYRTQLKAVRRFIHEECDIFKKESPAEQMHFEEDDIALSLKLNDEWNKEVAALRDQRLAREAKEERERNLEYMIQADQEAEERIKMIDSIVKEEKIKANSFITPENLDEAIDYALANPVDYNFAIDIKGNIIYGKASKIADAIQKSENASTNPV